MAADGVFLPGPRPAAPAYRTPWLAIIIQSTWSCILAATGRYEQLLNYVVFADWIFFGLTVGTVHRLSPDRSHWHRVPTGLVSRPRLSRRPDPVRPHLRRRRPQRRLRATPPSALRGALLLTLGIPIFFIFRARHRSQLTALGSEAHALEHSARALGTQHDLGPPAPWHPTWRGRRHARRPGATSPAATCSPARSTIFPVRGARSNCPDSNDNGYEPCSRR